MIPKKLISCWFGRGKKNDLFLRCREAKERVLPRGEWEWIDVDEDNCGPLMGTRYMQSVISRGEFVKCTELARIWALLAHGGVYMDEDVEPIRPLDPLLELPHKDGALIRFFVGREGAKPGEREWINGAVMGSEPGGVAASVLFEMFPTETEGREGAHFYGPGFLTHEIESLIELSPNGRLGIGGVVLKKDAFFPTDWFETLTPDEAIARAKPSTFAVHHWCKSWVGMPGC